VSKRESILHVHTVPVISGSGINTMLTMQGSLERGHDVSLVTQAPGPLTVQAEASGIRVFVISRMGREIRPIQDTLSVVELFRLIRRHRFSIVHTHNSKAGIVGRLAAWLARVPLVVHTVHGFSFHESETILRRALYRWIERLAAHWCHGLIFISQPLIDWADRERIGTGTPRSLIYSGINLEAFATADPATFRSKWHVAADRVVVGMVSKLWEGKGHSILLEAWRQVVAETPRQPPLLVIVGHGPLEGQLRAQASELGITDSVLFTGFLEDTPRVTAAIDIAVLPSFFEGMGRVVLEAQAAGKPVVASRVGGIPDLIDDRVNGILVTAGDADSLAREITGLVNAPGRRKSLGANARRQMSPEYSATHMIKAIHSFYDELLKNRE
jgi:glycosyltransferase involved in cell wall biosynthesis